MQAVVLGHYVVVLGNTRYFHIAIRVGLESFSGRCRDAPGDFTVLTPDISSSLECRLFLTVGVEHEVYMALEYGCADVIRPTHQLERRENYRKA